MPMPADTSSMCRSTHASGACHPVGIPKRTADAGLSKTFRMAEEGVVPDPSSNPRLR